MKSKLFIGLIILLIAFIGFYFHTPDIDSKDMIYFEKVKDSVIRHHEYFMTHHIGPSENSSDELVFKKKRARFVTNKNYFDLLKKADSNKTFFEPIDLLFQKKLIVDGDDKYDILNSLEVYPDSTFKFMVYEKKRFEGCKIGYLIYDPKEKIHLEKGYGKYDKVFDTNGWKYIKAVEPYFSND
ncbi:hypothetical protein NAT51_07275 [Flavobacterium amniphilum]|uniref:hypothetical protein n=1 Tax=Flavobacterium amniphilum TaxID=1834035 RepID=UPI00202AB419|nr:hypothetical protein [Flavobacterium amniphilum]MCL9805316.1 hypothetical protein [Flavobacterium amniphilum]